MIFLTVGTQLPFDRLVSALDDAYPKIGLPVLAQICKGNYNPRNFSKVYDHISKTEYDQIFIKASVIVSHAGMGSIITSLLHNKPVVVMPRLASLGEHRNEHQSATCKRLEGISGLYVSRSPEELLASIRMAIDSPRSASKLSAEELIFNLKHKIFSNEKQ